MFIESVRISEGRMMLAPLHERRMHDTSMEAFGRFHLPPLSSIEIPDWCQTGEIKMRILYGEELEEVSFTKYNHRDIKKLKIVEAGRDIDYHLKYADRTCIDRLYNMRGDCDDIIVVKDGKICDTSYTNIILTDGYRMYVPSSFLLPGVMRSWLIATGTVQIGDFGISDILPDNKWGFTHLMMINAMMPPESAITIPLESVVR